VNILLPNWELVTRYGALVPREATHWRNVVEHAFEEYDGHFIGTHFWNQILPAFLERHNAKYIDKIGMHKDWPDNDSALSFESENDMMIFLLKFA